MPSIDVAIPNYNYGRYLRECVESVLTQDCVNLRVLIIDNASTDNSVEIAQELAAKDQRIEIVARQKNLGPQKSWNDAIDWTSGDYFMVLCSDDMLTSGALSRSVSIMEQHPDVSVAMGACVYLKENEDNLLPKIDEPEIDSTWRIWESREFIRHICKHHHRNVTSLLVRGSAQKKAGYYRPGLPFTDDLEMALRLACYGRVAETRTFQFIQRLHDANISQALWKDPVASLNHWTAAFESFFANEGRLLPASGNLPRVVRRWVAKRAYWSAVSHLCRSDTDTAMKLFRLAIANHPATVLLPPVDYLFHVNNPFGRIAKALSGLTNRRARFP
jgi:glycosyltransferase involved in cell wall biosynthesis